MADRFSPIAVVGLGALFPGSAEPGGFWRDIVAGRDLLTDVPPDRWLIEDYYDPRPGTPDKTYAKRGAFLSAVDFDPLEHGVPPTVVPSTDTSQLLGLIVAKQVLEDATKHRFDKLDRDRVSVVLGITSAQELLVEAASRLQRPVWVKALREEGVPEDEVERICDRIANSYTPWQEMTFPGLLGNVVAGRIANRLNLGGTNCVTDAACASALSALSMGVSELRLGDSDMVIAGGVETFNDIFMYMCFSQTPAMSPSGDCRPFSSKADGTMLGEGLGLLALRRLEDAERDGDAIYAVIRGIGSSSDGRAKSIYAPVAAGQAKALRRAYQAAGYGPDTVELVEAHATGTKAGDAAEFEGLRTVFDESARADRQWCAVGSVKSQIGHTKAAAGAAGLMKAVFALQHRTLPPTAKVDAPNPQLEIEKSPFYLNVEARPWVRDGRHPRRASVSAFGFGGSNFHVTVEEYAGPAPRALRFRTFPTELFVLSAASPEELRAAIVKTRTDAEAAGWPRLARLSQEAFDAARPARLAVVAASTEDLLAKLADADKRVASSPREAFALPGGASYVFGAEPGKVAFLFPGQGSQALHMGRDLALGFETALAVWDRAAAQPFGDTPLHEVVFPKPAFDDAARDALGKRLTATEWAQPAIGAASLALLRLVEDLGLRPDAVAGHSFGELVALHAAGALSEADLLRVARQRGERMAAAAASTPGAMLAVANPVAEVRAILEAERLDVVVANHNSPKQVVLAGSVEAIDSAARVLKARGLTAKKLPVATAFHSPIVAPSSGPFREFLAGVAVGTPALPVYANETAAPYAASADAVREGLARQIAHPVRFADIVEALYADGVRTFVEVGPGAVLTGLVGECLAGRPHVAASLDRKGQHGVTALWNGLARLVVAGVPLKFDALWAGYRTPAPEPKKPGLRLQLTGATYAKPYPPKGGTAALPRPNPPRPIDGFRRRDEPGAGPMGATSDDSGLLRPQTPGLAAASPGPAIPSPAPSTGDPLTHDANWLAAWQEMQRQTAEAHAAYQRTMADTHAAFLRTSEVSFQALTQLAGGAPVAYSAPAPVAFAAPAPVAPAVPAAPAVAVAAPVVPAPVAAAPAPAPAAAPADLTPALLEVVAEKTGYPAEMLQLGMELEADLGVDSIKRVEILAALTERVPGLPSIGAGEMGSLRTLGQIAERLAASAPAAGIALGKPAAAPTAPAPVATGAPTADVTPALLAVVAEKTGYPAEMLQLGMELEADLGVDSIKRVEILAALTERVPGLPSIGAGEMGSLRTLGQIAERLAGSAAATAVPAPATAPEPKQAAELGHFALELRPTAPVGLPVGGLFTSGPITITDDGRGIAPLLAERLARLGADVRVGAVSGDEAGAIVLSGLRAVASDEDADAACREAFEAARALAARLADKGGLFVTVQDTGGDLGLAGRAPARAALGALAGLAKTAAQEWPLATARAIDVDSNGAPAAVAEALADELLHGGAAREVALDADGVRREPTSVPSAPAAGPLPCDASSVVVATGGARGVTADCLLALARATRARFALLGRTPLAEEPAAVRGVDGERELGQALLGAARAEGHSLSPAELRSAVSAMLSAREVRRTLALLEAAGSEAVYVAVDARDAAAVAAALDGVRQRFGPITGLVHGAGVLADRLLRDKTLEQFERVWGTKVPGLRGLVAATANDPLRFVALFSSVAGRCGNAGQSDYAMANEALNKTAAALAAQRPGCRVVAMGWGPWDGGMVTPALRERFAARCVPLVTRDRGPQMFLAELGRPAGECAEVVLGGEPRPEPLASEAAARETRFDVIVNSRTEPLLRDHAVAGAPVVPAAWVLDWFARAALALRPDLKLAAVRELKVVRGIRVADYDGRGAALALTVREVANGTGARLALELRGAGGVLHYTATAEMADQGLAAPERGVPGGPQRGEAAAHLYGEALFHGPAFHVLRGVEAVSAAGAAASCAGVPEQGWSGRFALDAAAVDGALQLAIVWGRQQAGADTLPTGLGAFVPRAAFPVQGPLRLELVARQSSALRTLSDVLAFDQGGAPVFELRDVEMHAVPAPDRKAPALQGAAS